MRTLLLLSALLLSGCGADQTHTAHAIAKSVGPAQSACYDMLAPPDIAGQYCLQYKGPLATPIPAPSAVQ